MRAKIYYVAGIVNAVVAGLDLAAGAYWWVAFNVLIGLICLTYSRSLREKAN